MGVFNKIIIYSDVCVHWRLSLERHQSTIDFDPGGVCGGPLFAPPFTSARVQSRFEFVELGNMYSNYQGEVPAVTGITGWCQLVPRTIYESTVRYICARIYGMYRYPRFTFRIRMNICVRTLCDVRMPYLKEYMHSFGDDFLWFFALTGYCLQCTLF